MSTAWPQLFSWWRRLPMRWFVCQTEFGHYFEKMHDEHALEPRVRWVLAWCRDCGELREVDI